jgi:hypothetical protein
VLEAADRDRGLRDVGGVVRGDAQLPGRFLMFDIAVKNVSSSVSDADIAKALPAFQRQVTEDFRAAYGIDATLHLVDRSRPFPRSMWQLAVLESADQAGALGYHEKTSAGLPLGKVFAGTTIKYGGLWSVTFSHELLEMLLDPWINLTIPDSDNKRSWSYEACDAVEADELGYKIDGVQVSDFVLPSYFENDITLAKSHKRSFCGHVTAPLSLAPGGYMSFVDWTTGEWSQIDASRAPGHAEKHSRHARRVLLPHQHRLSTAE